MNYFKNTELAKLYNVSEKTVRNWIQASREDKLGLQLMEKNGRYYIANIIRNTALIEKLIQKGKKYKNKRGFKQVSPSADFYERYTPNQVLDVISNLENYHEIPYQYTYFNGGAEHWDLYTQRLLGEESANYLKDIIELLDDNVAYLDKLLGKKNVNIIDIGLGNCLPVRKLLEHFLATKQLKRYIGIDISKDMLDIAERNITSWFGESINFERYVKDINYSRFNELLVNGSADEDTPTVNLVLFLGSTVSNFREPDHALHMIRESMGKDDLLIFTLKLDSMQSRLYFDFTTISQDSLHNFRGKDLLELLNIDPSFYELEQFFDEKTMMRQTRIRFKVAVLLEFRVGGHKKVVEFHKDDHILLWRVKHQSFMDTLAQLDRNGFKLLQAGRASNQEHILSISKVRTSE